MIVDGLDHFEHAPQAQVAGVRVELGADVVLKAIAGLGGALDRVLHRLDDDALVDHLLRRDRIRDRDQFGAVGGDGSGHQSSCPRFVFEFFFVGTSPERGRLPASKRSVISQLRVLDLAAKRNRRAGRRAAAIDGHDRRPSTPTRSPLNCLRPSIFSVERDARLVPCPVGEILRPGQRPVDAGARHFQPVRALDRILAGRLSMSS